jgi:hypothetical protein
VDCVHTPPAAAHREIFHLSDEFLKHALLDPG